MKRRSPPSASVTGSSDVLKRGDAMKFPRRERFLAEALEFINAFADGPLLHSKSQCDDSTSTSTVSIM